VQARLTRVTAWECMIIMCLSAGIVLECSYAYIVRLSATSTLAISVHLAEK
jgi:hypothetical protein